MRSLFAICIFLTAGSTLLPASELDVLDLLPAAPSQANRGSTAKPIIETRRPSAASTTVRSSSRKSPKTVKGFADPSIPQGPHIVRPFKGAVIKPAQSVLKRSRQIAPSAADLLLPSPPSMQIRKSPAVVPGYKATPTSPFEEPIEPPVGKQAKQHDQVRLVAPQASQQDASQGQAATPEIAAPEIAAPEALSSRLHVLPQNAAVGNSATVHSPSQVHIESDVPQLRVSTIGPDTLTVGKSARYTITLNNNSHFDATDVRVRCAIPSWVQVNDHQVTNGDVVNQPAEVVWQVSQVAAQGDQRLSLDLTPRAGKAFDLDVDIAVQPSKSRKSISIQEPMLAVDVSGPPDAVFGAPGTWKLKIENPGSGDANDVVIEVFSGNRKLESQFIGTIAAGNSRTADLELTAKATGTHQVRVAVQGAFGLKSETLSTFLCRRARLALHIDGPDFEYAGGETEYTLILRNDGNAAAKSVMLDVNLPTGMSYESGIASPNLTANGVSWIVDTIDAGEELSIPLSLGISGAGDHEIQVSASTPDKLNARSSVVTEALVSADLKLEVTDPRGPRPLGAVAEYEISIVNTGTDTARDVSVIAVCPPELDPIDVTGNAAIKLGQIFFKPITDLPPDHKVTFKVRVRAKKAGTHSFRVIMKCYEPEMRLATEEATRYFDREGHLKRAISKKTNRGDRQTRKPASVTQRDPEDGPSY